MTPHYPKITEYLQHNRVAKWATDGKLPDIYQFVAKTIREASDKVSPATLRSLLDEKFNDLKALLQKIRPIVPSTIREHIDDLLKYIDAKRSAISSAIQEFAQPARTVLKVVAKKLDDQAWRVQILRTNPRLDCPDFRIGVGETDQCEAAEVGEESCRERMKFPPLEIRRIRKLKR